MAVAYREADFIFAEGYNGPWFSTDASKETCEELNLNDFCNTDNVAELKRGFTELLKTNFVVITPKHIGKAEEEGKYNIYSYYYSFQKEALSGDIIHNGYKPPKLSTNQLAYYTSDVEEARSVFRSMEEAMANDNVVDFERMHEYLKSAGEFYFYPEIFNLAAKYSACAIFIYLYSLRTYSQVMQGRMYFKRYEEECIGTALKSGKRSVDQGGAAKEKLERFCVVPDSFYSNALSSRPRPGKQEREVIKDGKKTKIMVTVKDRKGDVAGLAMAFGIPCSQAVERSLMSDQTMSGLATMIRQFRDVNRCRGNPIKAKRLVNLVGYTKRCPYDSVYM